MPEKRPAFAPWACSNSCSISRLLGGQGKLHRRTFGQNQGSVYDHKVSLSQVDSASALKLILLISAQIVLGYNVGKRQQLSQQLWVMSLLLLRRYSKLFGRDNFADRLQLRQITISIPISAFHTCPMIALSFSFNI